MFRTIKYLGAILSVFCIAQFSQPAMAQTYVKHYALQSTGSATTVVTASTAYITTAVITVSTVGTNPIQITDTAGNVLFQAASTALGTIVNFSAGDKAAGIIAVGIKVVGPATAVVHVTITYYL